MAETITTKAGEAVARLADELDHTDRVIEEQAVRIEALEADSARLPGGGTHRT